MSLNPITLIAYIITLVIAITVHEFCHAWAGHRLGDVTAEREGRLSLNPIKHIDPFFTLLLPLLLIIVGSPVVFGAAKPVPFNPYAVRYGKWGAALVALAGPMSNLAMAAFVSLYLRLFELPDVATSVLVGFVMINIGFFVFNMLPIPPLDGSRVLYAASPPALADLLDRIERFGLAGIMLVLFLFYQFLSPFIVMLISSLGRVLLGSAASF
jgi:Zn-dependent protease